MWRQRADCLFELADVFSSSSAAGAEVVRERVLDWLQRAPVATALEARDTVAVQIVFIMTGIVVPLLGLGYVLGHPVEPFSWHSGSTLYLAVILGATVLAWACLSLARAGFVRLSLHSFLIVIPLLILCLHTGVGLQEQALVWVMALPPLALAGMVSGRRTLWLMLLFLQCCVLAGALHDLFFAGNPLGVPEVVAAVIVLSSGLLAAAILFDVMAAMIGTSAVPGPRI